MMAYLIYKARTNDQTCWRYPVVMTGVQITMLILFNLITGDQPEPVSDEGVSQIPGGVPYLRKLQILELVHLWYAGKLLHHAGKNLHGLQ
jgi:hypothetical protein